MKIADFNTGQHIRFVGPQEGVAFGGLSVWYLSVKPTDNSICIYMHICIYLYYNFSRCSRRCGIWVRVAQHCALEQPALHYMGPPGSSEQPDQPDQPEEQPPDEQLAEPEPAPQTQMTSTPTPAPQTEAKQEPRDRRRGRTEAKQEPRDRSRSPVPASN